MGKVNKKKAAAAAEFASDTENGGGSKSTTNDSSEKSDTEPTTTTTKNNKNNLNDSSDESYSQDNAKRDSISQDKSEGSDIINKKNKKRKAGALVTAKSGAVATESNEDNDSDDQPLNGRSAKGKGKAQKNTVKGKTVKETVAKTANATKNAKKARKSEETEVLAQHNNDVDDDNEDEEQEYEVERIIGTKVNNGHVYYLVRWKGYTKDDDTWEPEDTLNCPELIDAFNKKNKTPKKGNKTTPNKTLTSTSHVGTAGSANNRKQKKSDAVASTETDPNKEWEVEKIVDCIEDGSGRLFRIRWKGFRANHDTWEPESNLSCNDLIAKFTKRMDVMKNLEAKNLREEPKKTQRLVNETSPRTNYHNKIGRTSKRSITKNRVFYGEE